MKQHTKNRIGAGILTGIWTLGTLGLVLSCEKEPKPDPDPDPICECPVKDEKAHLKVGETCECPLGGCTLKVYGTLANGVKIHVKSDVENTKITETDIVGRAVTKYAGLTGFSKEDFDANITEIHIVPGNHNQTVRRGTILELGVDISQSRLATSFEDLGFVPEVAKGLNPTVKKA